MGTRDRRAGLLMKLLGRTEIESGRCPVAKHIPGTQNILAGSISRWSYEQMQDNVRRLTHNDNRMQQDIGDSGRAILDLLLQPKMPEQRMDDKIWNAMTSVNL